MSGFFEEVRRRKVYRVAVAYVVASGAIIQIASAVFPAWELPNWSLRLVIALLLIGFPIALILAWAYDITPHGIEVTPTAPTAHRRRNIIVLTAAGIVISAISGWFLLPRASAHKLEKSIAVLPFQNLSDDKENAYFSDGIQDDILTNLSKVSDLKVISRTSVMSYRDNRSRNAREIGKALGVATLLEGSVRRDGNRVRVNVQLIDADNDAHIWAEDYDRDLSDVFAIQSDLAQKITTALQAKLSPDEKSRLSRKPTDNSQAYVLFLQAQQYAASPDMRSDDVRIAAQLYEQAIKLDPKFAAAYAGLSYVESWAYHTFDPTEARLGKARQAAQEALRLEPELPEGHLARGFLYYYGERNYDLALAEFEIAKSGLPNQADAYLAIGAIQRRQGKWTESTTNMEKAVALDPRNIGFLYNLGASYLAQREFDKADEVFDRTIAVSPQSFSARALKGVAAIYGKGDVIRAQEQLDLVPPATDTDGLVTSTRVWVLVLARKYGAALDALKPFPGEVLNAHYGPSPKAFLEGLIYLGLGDNEKASQSFEKARLVAERLVQETPDDVSRRGLLGQVLALLGEKEAAVAEGKKAAELLPESRDAYDGPQVTVTLASIYTCVGERDEALRLLDHLLQIPSGITVPLLKLDPAWDPLREDPRFQSLIEKYSVKT